MYSISEIVGSAPRNIHSLSCSKRKRKRERDRTEKSEVRETEKEGGARERMTTTGKAFEKA